MPIYAYRCSACGHAEDIMQKMNAAPFTECPACHQATFSKQLTAPGFQLKGSGWYASDFKSRPSAPKEEAAPAAATPCGGSCACH
ncbi:MAG: zinc ribbon domain-containing protein [Methylobacillus sp.]|jgi:putative FmdB family regulatory protein|nr:zinc ribbon domain-containing protein [Methylobacillus sp.]